MGVKKLRVYVDTSVIGGCFDDAFERDSVRLFDEFRAGKKVLVVSDLVADELEGAPPEVQHVIADLPDGSVERLSLDEEAADLANAYLDASVVAAGSLSDARHIALASAANVDALVSWNFSHIVNLSRIRQYHAVNVRLGYPMIEIRSPTEILENED